MDSSQINYHQNVPMVFRSGPLLRFLLFFLTSTFGIASNRVGFRTTSLFSLGEVLPKENNNCSVFFKLEQIMSSSRNKRGRMVFVRLYCIVVCIPDMSI